MYIKYAKYNDLNYLDRLRQFLKYESFKKTLEGIGKKSLGII